MFGYVSASLKELSEPQRQRYQAVYCGLCRGIRRSAGQAARLSLSYDMAFLALLHMSLYEPEESGGPSACKLHPFHKRPWTGCGVIDYCADMNVALAYFNCMDDWQDDHSHRAKRMAEQLSPSLSAIAQRWPRQCQAIEICLKRLSQLEKAGCSNPDEPANCFGELMAELMVYEEDLWAPILREMGRHLGRFVYLADAMMDFAKDERKGKYNPYVAAGIRDVKEQERHLVLAMGRCTAEFEKLPLVQDKAILDNILYGGVWLKFPRKKKEKEADQ